MFCKPKRIVILGAGGIIGKYLFNHFSSDSQLEVRGFSKSSCNLLSQDDLRRVFSGVGENDAVIMTATTNRLKENSYNSMSENIEMAENVSRVLLEKKVGYFMFFSTVDVYGINIQDEEEIDESYLPNPNDYYSISKLASEYLLRKVCLRQNIPLKILRLSGVYGPGDNGRSTVGALMNSAFNKREVQVYGSGEFLRDYVYIEDVFKIVKLSIENRKTSLLNVATGTSLSILHIVDILHRLIPHEFEVIFKAKIESSGERRVKNLKFDVSLLDKSFPDLKMTALSRGMSFYLDSLLKDSRNISV